MTKNQKRALRFAYAVMCGKFEAARLPYLHIILQNGRATPRHWIEPDQDAERPYLNEHIFTTLEMRGYMEREPRPPGPLWLYRISPEGCAVMGKPWPFDPPIVAELNEIPEPPTVDRRLRLRFRERGYGSKYNAEPQIIIRRFRRSSDWRRG